MTRDDLTRWQKRMVHICARHIQTSYEIQGFDGVADIDMKPIEDTLNDAISDAVGKAWKALDPYAWTNEPRDGTRSDDLHDGRYLAR